MPRGIPNAKPATKSADAKKPGPKPGAKAAAAKPAVVKPTIQPLPAATTTNQLATVGLIDTPTKGTATMTPVSPAVAEAIAKIEAATKPQRNMPRPYLEQGDRRDNYLSVVGQKKGLRQTATLYLEGEALASTQDVTVDSEYCCLFLVDGKQHPFQYVVDSDRHYDFSDYTGVRLSPVDREEVDKIIKSSNKTALALAEDEVTLLLQQDRPEFKRGDVVAHMVDKGHRWLVVEAPQPADPYRRGAQPFGRDANAVEFDMVVMELNASYDAASTTSMILVGTEPKKVYSGLYLLAE